MEGEEDEVMVAVAAMAQLKRCRAAQSGVTAARRALHAIDA